MSKYLRKMATILVAALMLFTSLSFEGIIAYADDVRSDTTLSAESSNAKVIVVDSNGVLPEGTELRVTNVSSDTAEEIAKAKIGGKFSKIKGIKLSFFVDGEEIHPSTSSLKITVRFKGMPSDATTVSVDRGGNLYYVSAVKAKEAEKPKDETPQDPATGNDTPSEPANNGQNDEPGNSGNSGNENPGNQNNNPVETPSTGNEDPGNQNDNHGNNDNQGTQKPAVKPSNDNPGTEKPGASADSSTDKPAPVKIIDEKPAKVDTETPDDGSGDDKPSIEIPTIDPIKVVPNEEKGQNRGEDDEFWTVTFYNRDAEVHTTVQVTKGEAIGTLPAVIAREDYNAYWAVGEIVQGGQGQEIHVLGPRITSSWVPSSDTIIVPDYEPITYTVSFFENETDTTPITTKTVSASTSYCLNDIPTVPVKNGYVGKWVYSGGDFTNSVHMTADTRVWAEYEQNVFTVTYMVGNDTYKTDTYYTGDHLQLPADPVVEGKDFVGWYKGETQYVGGESVTSNLTLTAVFEDQFFVKFVVLNDNGTIKETLSQYFRSAGEAIATMPQDPFVAGKVFVRWENQDTHEEVTASTIVNGDITAVAVFRTIEIYKITAQYWYLNDRGEEVVFNTDLSEVEAHELPYTITAPATTQTDPNEVSGAPIYYPNTPTVTVNEGDFDSNKEVTVRIQYVPYTAVYDYVYMLKDLTGEGYSEIEREHVYGVLNSYVTPTVKSYNYANLELAEGATITLAAGQELYVYYTRKNFQVSYDSKGGSYVAGATVPYGTNYSVSSTTPTRTGYTFAGWFLDEDCTQAAGNSFPVNSNVTLYAKWTGDTVNYTIVYMFEKYDDTGTTASYVYDNSRTGTGRVGDTVNASSAPSITRTGWEVDTARNNTSSAVIAADGSSVLYVYYKLTTYTLNFNRNHRSGHSDYIVEPDGTHNTGTYTITVKIGQDISTLWPSADCTSYNCNFRGWQKNGQGTRYITKQLIMNTDLLPSSGTSVTYQANWGSATKHTVNYYLENADDDGYTKSTTYSQEYYSDSNSLTPKAITGYIYDHSANSGNTFNFYYKRVRYQIDYYYGSTNLDTISDVKFDANINKSPYTWTPTQAQCGVDSDYTFVGWFDNSGCQGDPYTFDKMPASNLVLYAKWSAPKYTVTFVDGEDISTVYETLTDVVKYSRVSAPETSPTKTGFIFDGWYSSADGTQLFDWSTQITDNTTIYAHWTRQTLSYTVHYVDEDGNPLAADKTVTNPNYVVGQDITEQAIAIAGYRPNTNSETLTLSSDESENVITFVYSEKADYTSYTVRYILDPAEYPGDIPVADAITVENVPGDTASVIEIAAAVDYTALYAAHPELNGVEFFPDAAEKTLVLTANAETNVFTFYYSSYKNANVVVHYRDLDGNPIADDHTEVLKVGKTFSLSRTPIEGWELDKAVVGTSYSGAAAGDSYKITEAITANGLEFTIYYKKRVTITVNSATKQYDGTALTLPATMAEQIIVEGLPEGETLTSIAFEYQNADNSTHDGRINAGTAVVTPKDAVTSATNHVEGYYAFRYISGTLEVTKINVTIRLEPDRWTGNVYDGTVKKTGFTNPSKSKADYVLISHEDYANSYLNDIWTAIISKTDEVFYDASAAGFGYYGVAEKDAGEYTYWENLLTLADLPDDPNYSVSIYIRPGRLQILPKDITIATASAEKAFDGTPLTKTDEYTVEGIIDGETYGFEVTGSRTDLGSSENTYQITWGGEDNSYTALEKNYNVTDNLGTLTVTKGTLTITVKDKTTTYNGADQSGYTLPASINGTGETITTDEYVIEGLANGHVLKVTGYVLSTGKNVGTYENGSFADAVITIEDSNGTDVTEFYNTPTTNAGKLIINKATLDITALTQTYEYNGSAQGENNATYTTGFDTKISYEGLQGSDQLASITLNGTEINAASYTAKIAPSAAIVMNGDDDVTSNYDIIYRAGTLIITKAPLTITVKDQTYPYNGQAQGENNQTYTEGFADKVEVDGLKGQDALTSITLDGQRTNVGEYPEEIKGSAAAIGEATNNYDITYVDGKLTITALKVTVTITGDHSTDPYDGAAHTVTGYTFASSDDLYLESYMSYTGTGATASRTDVGTEYMGLAEGQFVNNNSNFDVTFQVVDGYQTITAINVTVNITGNNNSTVYDGSDHTVTGYRVTDISTPLYTEADFTFSGTASATRTDVGTEYMNLTASQFTNINPNFATVTFNVIDGYQTITKLAITVTIVGDHNTTTYDGASHTVTGYTATPSSNLYDVENDFDFSGSATATRTEYGTTNMGLAADQFTNTNDNFEVTFNVTDGYQTIEKLLVEVKITGNTDSKTYNGSEQDVSGYEVEISNSLYTESDFSFNGSSVASGKDVGVYEMGLEADDFTNNNDNFSVTFTIVSDGSLTINPKEVTVKAKDDSKVYGDADPAEFEAEVTGLVAGDAILYTVSRAEGEDVGQYTITPAGATTQGNYTVTYETGIFTITPKTVVVKAKDDGKTYGNADPAEFEVEITGLVGDDTVEYTVSREPGENVGEYTITPSGETTQGNYTVTYQTGTFTINKRDVTITVKDQTYDYDGTPKGETGTTYTSATDINRKVTVDGLKDGDSLTSITITGSETNVGDYEGKLVASDAAIGNQTDNYTIIYVNGNLAIIPAEIVVKIKGTREEHDYKGSEWIVTGYTASSTSNLFDPAKVSITPEGKDTVSGVTVGTYPMGLARADFRYNDDNINVDFQIEEDGQLIINPAKVTITVIDQEYTYNGSAQGEDNSTYNADQVSSKVTVSGLIGDDKLVKIILDGNEINAGEYTGKIKASGAVIEDATTTGNYEIEYVAGKLTITKATLTITAKDQEYTYNGGPQGENNATYTDSSKVTVEGLQGSDALTSITLNGQETNAGEYTGKIVPSAAEIGENTGNYEITYKAGTLTITKATLKITANPQEYTYNGEPQGENNATYTDASKVTVEGLQGNDALTSITLNGQETNAGEYTGKIVPSAAEIGENTGNYEIEYVAGKLTITKATLTITAKDQEYTYNGYSQGEVSDTYTDASKVTVEGLQGDDALTSITLNGSATNAGIYEDHIFPSQAEIGEHTGNYEIEYVAGTLTITKATLTITAKDQEYTYNGGPQGEDYATYTDASKVTVDGLQGGDTLTSITLDGQKTNVGVYHNEIVPSEAVVMNDNIDVTYNYEIEYVAGTLTITKATLKITANDQKYTYNGEPQGEDNATYTDASKVTVVGLQGDDALTSITLNGQETNAGEYTGKIVPSAAEIGENTGNYEIEYVAGKLTIDKLVVSVIITGNTDSKTYNGAEQKVEGYEVEISDPLYTVNDFTFTGEAIAKGTNVNTYPMGLNASQFRNNNQNFDVGFVIEDGELEITKATLKITANDQEYTYNGGPQGEDNATYTDASKVTVEGLQGNDALTSITLNGQETNAGEYTGKIVPSAAEIGENTGNYDIEYVAGTLTITKVDLTITVLPQEYTYNGQPHGENNITYTSGFDAKVSVEGLQGNDALTSITLNGEETAAGTYENKIEGSNALIGEHTGNYNITINPGKLTINKAGVTVTLFGNTSTLGYDGDNHVIEGYEVESIKINGEDTLLYTRNDFTLVDGATAHAERTYVGKTDMGLTENSFVNINPNFEEVTFVVTDGYQEITKASLTITADSASKEYDGQPLTDDGWQDTAPDGLQGTDAVTSVTVTGEITEVGTEPNVPSAAVVKNGDVDVTANYDIEYVNGTLEITQSTKALVITSATKSWTYDGETHTEEVYTVTYNGTEVEADETGKVFTLPTGDTITITATAEGVKYVADSDTANNTFTYVLAKANQYANITTEFGTLSITPREVTVTITGNTDSKVYNGAEQKVEGYEVEISDNLYTEDDFTFSGEAIATGTDVDTYPMGLEEDQFTNTNPNFEVTFDVTDGELEIIKADLKITVIDQSYVYNADYQGENEATYTSGLDAKVTVEGLQGNDELTSIKLDGQQKDAGEYVDEIVASEAKVNGAAATKNYNVEYVAGKLTITKRPVTVTITGHIDTKIYSGANFTVEGYDVDISDDLYTENDFTFSGEASATGMDVDVYPMGLSEEQFENTNNNFEVTFDVTDGYLEITPLNRVVVTITGRNNTTGYDGAPHSVSGYTVSISNPAYKVRDFEFHGTATATRTNAGTTYMGLAASQFVNINPNFTNVVFRVIDGYQRITPVTITVDVTGNSLTAVYDGTEQSVEGYEMSCSDNRFNLADVRFNGTANASGTDVGTYPMGLQASQFSSADDNFNVVFVVHDGSVTIDPRPVTVTADAIVKNEGDPDPELTATIENTVNNDPIEYTISRTPGENVGTYIIDVDGPEKQGNYVVTFVDSTLTIEDTPLVNNPTWALLNLLCCIGTVGTGLGMLITYFKKKKKEDEEEEEKKNEDEKATAEANASAKKEEEDKEEDENKRRKSKFLGLLPSIGSVIAFILTEDMTADMVWTDKWTLMMIVILLVNLVLAYLTRNKDKKDDDDEDKDEKKTEEVPAEA